MVRAAGVEPTTWLEPKGEILLSIARSRAARSALVCPPLTIFFNQGHGLNNKMKKYLRNDKADADCHASQFWHFKMNLITYTREIQPQTLPQTVTRLNTREIQPRIQPQAVTRLDGEQLVINFAKGWRVERDSNKITYFSPTDEAIAQTAAFRGFKTFSAFENWLFSGVHFRYQKVGAALIQVPTRQVGIGRRLAVNKLDIVIREYEYENRRKYLGVAGVRLRDVSVSMVFKSTWDAIVEHRKIFENSVQSVRFIPKSLM
jgi:hypothetical protein